MKNNFLPRLLAASALLLAGSCQKVVTLNLKDSAPQLVIEANLADDGHPCTVKLSQSVDFTQTNIFPAVSGAIITLSDDAGHSETLPETSVPGQYQGRAVLGQSGRRYTLRVQAGGQSYVAASTLPAPVVPLTGLHAQKSNSGNNIQVVPEYQDPAGVPNFYLFRQYRNGLLNPAIFLQSDEFTDGKANTRALGGGGRGNSGGGSGTDVNKLATGDSVRVEMQNIDSTAYTYFRTLNLLLQNNQLLSTTPANPRTNFSGGAQGYFSAHSRRQRTLIVPTL
ncbi:DUF4249 domain-containing protein [Hymenobacter baengnokdamensis]|uniref:DUF4249 domain-containing protein n=1 Tax=Hymenobacter baengnokdamensis TaxID=2615203 RepID=UPI001246B41E|nr:DUF4249 domain-containing protein [Hymenobacter baengnokdamensis]